MTAPAAPLTAAGIKTAFGTSLRRLRIERGWSQEHLSALTGVCLTTISTAETGRRGVCLYTAVTLARALGSGVDAMLSGEGPNAHAECDAKNWGTS